MSIFSRIVKNVKRAVRTVAPIAATFLPGIGGIIAGLIPPKTVQAGRTPGIIPDIVRPPLPGAGAVPTARARGLFGRSTPSTAQRPIIVPGPARQEMSIFAAIPAIVRGAAPLARTIGRGLTGRTAAAAGLGVALGQTFDGAVGGACPSGSHLAKDGSGRCVKNRRMNFGNARAARRSVRRLKGARKLLKDIESMMPRRPASRARHGPTSPPHAGG